MTDKVNYREAFLLCIIIFLKINVLTELFGLYLLNHNDINNIFLGHNLSAVTVKTEKNVEIVSDEQNMFIDDDLVIKQV